MRYQPIAAAITTVALLGAGIASANAASWDDEGANDDVTTVENWVGDVLPSFPPAEDFDFTIAGDSANQNGGDGYAMASITIGRDFAIRGQRILLNGNLTVTGPYAVGLSVPVDLNSGGSVGWDVFSGATLTMDDVLNIEGNNYLVINTDGLVQFVPGGAINGDAGSNVIQDGEGLVVLAGGGNVTRYDMLGGTLHSASVMPNMGVGLLGGFLSGGSVTNVLGNEQLVASVELDNASRLSPGPDVLGATLGIFHSSGPVTGNPNATYIVDYDATTSDLVVTQGVFSADGMQLGLVPGATPAVGTEFVIVDAAGGPEPGSFFSNDGDILTDDEVFFADPGYFRIEYRTTEIVLVYLGETAPTSPPAPTPGAAPGLPATGLEQNSALIAVALLALLAGAVLVARRRRTN